MMTHVVMKSMRTSKVCSLLVMFAVPVGCVTTSVERFAGPEGVRFHGNEVREKIVWSGIVRQKYSPFVWENGGRYSVQSGEMWNRETVDGKKVRLSKDSRLVGFGVVFYPMVGTNGWIGVSSCRVISILNDVVGRGATVGMHSRKYTDELRVAQRLFSRTYLPMEEEEAEKAFDPFLFDGNRRLMYRTFNPDEQYYEYDALAETLVPVTTQRVVEVKKTYKDLFRIPVGGQFRYWKLDKDNRLVPDYQYYRPLDPVKDAVPQWKP